MRKHSGVAISFLKGLASLILPFLEYEIATASLSGSLAMTAREIVIARSEATKQSNEIAKGSLSGALAMTKW
jgi:hypothetical protein